MKDLLSAVEQAIRERAQPARGQSLLVAVSGGLDSMVLLHVLHRLAPTFGWKLCVAHFNHRLRGRESEGDERFVKASAKKLGLRFIAGRWDGERAEAIREFGLEMAARNARHCFLGETARKLKISMVVLAHHADDQVELFLMRLLRGSGGEGLAGMKSLSPMMPPYSRIRLIRPLLELSKRDLKEFARERGIAFREDSSNQRHAQLRNRIRLELIPLLEKKYEPAVTRTILRSMEILGSDADYVSQAARAWLERKPREPFRRLHPALQRQCLRLQLEQAGLPTDFALIERLRGTPNELVAVSPECHIRRDDHGTVTSHETCKVEFQPSEGSLTITGRSGSRAFEGLNLNWSRERVAGNNLRFQTIPGREYFDADKVGAMIILRHWRAGDRFQPIGMAREVKLQDLFTNQKIPRSCRHGLVVATTAAGLIFWVEGIRISEQFKLDKTTRTRLKWEWQRPRS